QGVWIPGFGTFISCSRDKKTEVGNNRFIVIQRPVFIMAEKLVQLHGLRQNDIHIDIPVVPLKFAMVSLATPFSRDLMESCVKETLCMFSRSIYTKKGVDFIFKGIGILSIKSSKVKMKFLKDFVSTLDESWAVEKALTNRPDTGDSMLSSIETSGRPPSSAFVFPR
ncbi:CCD81 protein, partial [Crocuta crocuta]